MKLKALLIAGVIASMPLSVQAGDAAAGKAKSVMCAACHGADGIAIMPNYPNLAGQNAPYLESSLKAYRDGQRAAGQAVMMKGMVAGLTDEDISNLAAYFSSL